MTNVKYNVDESFFEKIDSDEKAYVLGFIWGDGHIEKRKSNHQLNIELASKDVEILLKIRDALSSNHKIYKRSRMRKNTKIHSSSLIIPRKKVVADLINLGITINKTWSLKYPKIDDKFFPSFLLGLSDSDGCIRIDEENRVLWSLILANDLAKIIINKLGALNINIIQKKRKYKSGNTLTVIKLTDKNSVIALRNIIYNNSSIFLKRKKEIFDSVSFKERDVNGEKNPFYGKTHSIKSKAKMSKSRLGNNNPNSKLDADKVSIIKRSLSEGVLIKIIANKFNVSSQTIRQIKRGETWLHVSAKKAE